MSEHDRGDRRDAADDGPLATALLQAGQFLRRADASPDLHTLYQVGGREADAFYRTGGATTRSCVPPTA